MLRRYGGLGEEESSCSVLGVVSHYFDFVEIFSPSPCFHRYWVEC